MFLTIAFVLYAAMVAAVAGLLIARSGRDTVVDQAAESRLDASNSLARPPAEPGRPVTEGRQRSGASEPGARRCRHATIEIGSSPDGDTGGK